MESPNGPIPNSYNFSHRLPLVNLKENPSLDNRIKNLLGDIFRFDAEPIDVTDDDFSHSIAIINYNNQFINLIKECKNKSLRESVGNIYCSEFITPIFGNEMVTQFIHPKHKTLSEADVCVVASFFNENKEMLNEQVQILTKKFEDLCSIIGKKLTKPIDEIDLKIIGELLDFNRKKSNKLEELKTIIEANINSKKQSSKDLVALKELREVIKKHLKLAQIAQSQLLERCKGILELRETSGIAEFLDLTYHDLSPSHVIAVTHFLKTNHLTPIQIDILRKKFEKLCPSGEQRFNVAIRKFDLQNVKKLFSELYNLKEIIKKPYGENGFYNVIYKHLDFLLEIEVLLEDSKIVDFISPVTSSFSLEYAKSIIKLLKTNEISPFQIEILTRKFEDLALKDPFIISMDSIPQNKTDQIESFLLLGKFIKNMMKNKTNDKLDESLGKIYGIVRKLRNFLQNREVVALKALQISSMKPKKINQCKVI